MKTYTTRFHVDAPPATVFEYMIDPTTAMPGMSKMEVLLETPGFLGSVWRYEERILGMRFTGLFVITEFVRNKRLKGEFSGSLEEGSGVWMFKGVRGGTDVTIESSFRVRLPLVGPLAARLMMRGNEKVWLPKLKKEMEEYAHTHKVAA
jgi:hypothetical protein